MRALFSGSGAELLAAFGVAQVSFWDRAPGGFLFLLIVVGKVLKTKKSLPGIFWIFYEFGLRKS